MAGETTSKRDRRNSNSGSSISRFAGNASRCNVRVNGGTRTSATADFSRGPARKSNGRLINGGSSNVTPITFNSTNVSRANYVKPSLPPPRRCNDVNGDRTSFHSRVNLATSRNSRGGVTPAGNLLNDISSRMRNPNGMSRNSCNGPLTNKPRINATTTRENKLPITIGSSVNSAATIVTSRGRTSSNGMPQTTSACCKKRANDQSITRTPSGTYNGLPHSTKTTPQTAIDSPQTRTTIELPEDRSQTTRLPQGKRTTTPQPEDDTLGDDVVEAEELQQDEEGGSAALSSGTEESEADGQQGDDEEQQDKEESTTPGQEPEEPKVGQENEEEPNVGQRRGPLEYDLKYMYPEMELLTKAPRREWDYNDPEVIRAMWLETKTHALSDWKEKFVRIKRDPDKKVEIHDNNAVRLRNEFRRMKQEKQEVDEASFIIGRDAPQYPELTLPTTVTAQLRYKLNRDEPPIPDRFIFHYAKYKKPPFIKNSLPHDSCKLPDIGN